MLDKKIAAETKAEDMRFDVRVVPHAVRRGTLSHADVDGHLADLPDDAAEAEPSGVAFTTPFADRTAREAAAQDD